MEVTTTETLSIYQRAVKVDAKRATGARSLEPELSELLGAIFEAARREVR